MGASCISVVVIPISDVHTKLVEYLAQRLKVCFDRCTVGDTMDMPASAYNSLRGQYMSSLILQVLLEAHKATQAKLLAVTQSDLYAPGLEYVVGQAQAEGAVLSLRRLGAANESVYRSRIVKEAIHELGHTMGLRHCPDRLCAMHYSRYVHEIDVKSHRFCSKCMVSLCHVGAEYADIT